MEHTAASINEPRVGANWATYWSPQFDHYNGYGRIASILGKAVSAGYGDDRTKYQVICGFQQEGSFTTAINKLNSATYVAETGQASDAARNWVTHVCISNYWTSSFLGTAQETTWAAEYTGATAERRIEILNEYVSSASGTNSDGVYSANSANLTYKNDTNAYNTTYGTSLKMTNYEGMYSNVGYNQSVPATAEVNTMRIASLYAPELYRMTQFHISYLESIGVEFPSLFQMDGDNDWGNFIPNTYANPSEQWNGIAEYITQASLLMGGLSSLSFRR